MSFQTRKTFVHLRNIFDEMQELSDPAANGKQQRNYHVQGSET